MLQPPSITVVVPSRERPERLQRLLSALLDQDVVVGHEILVVVDGVDDATVRCVEGFTAPTNGMAKLRHVVRSIQGGPGAARNTGLARATGEVVAFIDDDCVPGRAWLRTLTAPILAGEAAFTQGRTERLGPALPRDRWVRSFAITAPSGRYETCNMAYRRDLLESLNGFDETFSRAGEDADLGLRALHHGAAFAFVDDAVIEHERVQEDFARMLRSRARAVDLPELVRRHPLLRNELVATVFWDRRHATAWTILVAAGIGGRLLPGSGAAVLGLWVVRRSRRFPDAGLPRRITLAAGSCVADIWELAQTLRGSVRARTLLL